MAPAPVAIGKTAVPVPQNTDGGSPAPAKVSSENQEDNASFPQLMKKVKGGSDTKKEGKSDKGSDNPVVPLVLVPAHNPDPGLPLHGIQLPLHLTQGPASGQFDATTTEQQSQTTIAVGKGGKGGKGGNTGKAPIIINLGDTEAKAQGKDGKQATGSVNDKAAALLHVDQHVDPKAASSVATNAKAATSVVTNANAAQVPLVDGQSQTSDKPDFSTLVTSLQHNSTTAQVLNHDLKAAALDKHSGLIDTTSHPGMDAANGLTGMNQAADKPNQTASAPPAISVPLKNPDWGDELSNRVSWMVQHDVQTANIKINPPHLGPLEVHVSMSKDHVDVSFNSHHAAVKEALDASMPKLKEMLGSSGLQLGDANVNQHSFSGQNQHNSQGTNYSQSADTGAQGGISSFTVDDGETGGSMVYSWDPGRIDFYA